MQIEKIKLIYYSPTGTSEKTVKAIQKGICIDYDAINLTLPDSEMKQYSLKETDLAIIAAPVYGGRIAATAMKRLKKVTGENTPSVLVALYGNRAFDDALLELKDITEENGFKAVAAAAFIGEHSYDAPETPIASGRPDSKDLRIAEEYGGKVKEKLANLETISELTLPGNRPYREGSKTGGRSPETDPDICILCGLCARVCPTGSVTVTDIVETEKDYCTFCTACVKNCPTGARHWEHERILQAAEWLSTEHGDRKEPELFL